MKQWNEPRTIRIANGVTVMAKGYSTGSLGPLHLAEVWYVPAFKNLRLLLVKSLALDSYSIIFEGDTVTCSKHGDIVFETCINQGRYIVKDGRAFFTNRGENDPLDDTIRLDESNADLWHQRLGYTNLMDIQKLEKASKGIKLGLIVKTVGRRACECCLAGKMKESFNKKTDSRQCQRIRKLYADTSGILPISIRGYRYFLLVICDATRATWIRLLKSKGTADVLLALLGIKTQIEKETRDKVVQVRCDNGKGEFGQAFQDEMKKEGVQVEPCLAYKHLMNGVVERAMYTIDCKIRSMIY
jgi:hypothetical protein